MVARPRAAAVVLVAHGVLFDAGIWFGVSGVRELGKQRGIKGAFGNLQQQRDMFLILLWPRLLDLKQGGNDTLA